MKSIMNSNAFHYYSQKGHIEYTAFIHEKLRNYNVNLQHKTPYGLAFCEMPKRQSARAAQLYKMANTANIFEHFGL